MTEKERKRELKGRGTTLPYTTNAMLWKGLETSFHRARWHRIHAINNLPSRDVAAAVVIVTEEILETIEH